MKAIKTTMVVLMSLLFTFLLCCTILGWENLTAKEKKEYTKAEMLANYELGRNDEKANSENTISDLISKHQAELLKLQQKYNDLNTQKNELANEVKNLETENSSQKALISDLNAEIKELENQISILQAEINSFYRYKTQLWVYDFSGNTIGDYTYVDEYYYTIPSTLPNGTAVNEWILEYISFDPIGNETQFCDVISSGTTIQLGSTGRIDLKAVSGEVYDVTFYAHGHTYNTKVNSGSHVAETCLLSNFMHCESYQCSLTTSFIQEEFINGQWIEVANSSNYWFATTITNTTRFICKYRGHDDDTLELPQEPNN